MTITAKFNSRCSRCNNTVTVGQLIIWTKGVKNVTHAKLADCVASPPPVVVAQVPAVVVEAAGIVAFLAAAKARGLKFPKARFLAADGRSEMRLSLAGSGAKVPGSVQVLIGETWVGRIEPTGAVVGRLRFDEANLEALRVIAQDPATAAKAYGALMCRCSFCNLPLTDAGSVEVGYGPVCADHWGLPHKAKGTPVVAQVVPTAPVSTTEPLTFDDFKQGVLDDMSTTDFERAIADTSYPTLTW